MWQQCFSKQAAVAGTLVPKGQRFVFGEHLLSVLLLLPVTVSPRCAPPLLSSQVVHGASTRAQFQVWALFLGLANQKDPLA